MFVVQCCNGTSIGDAIETTADSVVIDEGRDRAGVDVIDSVVCSGNRAIVCECGDGRSIVNTVYSIMYDTTA